MYDDRHKCVALVIARGGVMDVEVADFVPAACWAQLEREGLVTEAGSPPPGMGPVTRTTSEGLDWLRERLRG